MKVGTYVISTADSGRYYRAIYRVTGESFDRSIVEHVADIVNGRPQWVTGQRAITHRDTSKLQEYTFA